MDFKQIEATRSHLYPVPSQFIIFLKCNMYVFNCSAREIIHKVREFQMKFSVTLILVEILLRQGGVTTPSNFWWWRFIIIIT